jgi:hypothetical protein
VALADAVVLADSPDHPALVLQGRFGKDPSASHHSQARGGTLQRGRGFTDPP